MQVFDSGNGHAWWEVFCESGKGVYAYLFSNDGSSHDTYHIDTNWSVGQKFTMKTVISGGRLKFYYNDMSNTNQSIAVPNLSQVHFKIGDYCQSSQSQDPSTDYCKVAVSALSFSHV